MSKGKRGKGRRVTVFGRLAAVVVLCAVAFAFVYCVGTPDQRIAELKEARAIAFAKRDAEVARADTERRKIEAEHAREMERMKQERTEFQWRETEAHAAAEHARAIEARAREHEAEMKRLAMDHDMRYRIKHMETEADIIKATAQIPREVETRTFLTTTKKFYGPVRLGESELRSVGIEGSVRTPALTLGSESD